MGRVWFLRHPRSAWQGYGRCYYMGVPGKFRERRLCLKFLPRGFVDSFFWTLPAAPAPGYTRQQSMGRVFSFFWNPPRKLWGGFFVPALDVSAPVK